MITRKLLGETIHVSLFPDVVLGIKIGDQKSLIFAYPNDMASSQKSADHLFPIGHISETIWKLTDC